MITNNFDYHEEEHRRLTALLETDNPASDSDSPISNKYIRSQTATPGTPQTANANLSGKLIAGGLVSSANGTARPANLSNTGELYTDVNGIMWQSGDTAGNKWGQIIPRSTFANRATTNLKTGQLWQFSDYEDAIFIYNGTHYITQQIYTAEYRQRNGSIILNSTATLYTPVRPAPLYSMQLKIRLISSVAHDNSNYYSWTLDHWGISSGTVDSKTHDGDTTYTYNEGDFTNNPQATSDVIHGINFTKTGTPADIEVYAIIAYRLKRN